MSSRYYRIGTSVAQEEGPGPLPKGVVEIGQVEFNASLAASRVAAEESDKKVKDEVEEQNLEKLEIRLERLKVPFRERQQAEEPEEIEMHRCRMFNNSHTILRTVVQTQP